MLSCWYERSVAARNLALLAAGVVFVVAGFTGVASNTLQLSHVAVWFPLPGESQNGKESIADVGSKRSNDDAGARSLSQPLTVYNEAPKVPVFNPC